ncbi:hypothetical protein TSOC_006905 [Tetrabaena socialis]|uniref:MYND-type domain-containing protein n=1 Tax=Tetrabaena socialis TaxID=47790 RepID=A0A2J8A2H7_9CHLO|nr:hypothetical protein TSOC_006905 [Tetrabaena socialis]|eukprot:PNH06688.1 hypothetical protein TSOC_006905 [Tetrabaena socialis]
MIRNMLRAMDDERCSLTPEQKQNLMLKLGRVDDAIEQLMDDSVKQNELSLLATDTEYKGAGIRRYAKALKLYQRAIEEDKHPLAMCNLALWYLQGRPGTAEDPPKAVELFERAAEMGVGMALANLAEFAQHGLHGVPKDDERAVKLARAAIDDDRHTSDSLAMAFMVLFRSHHEDRPGAPMRLRAALRCLEYAALIGGDANSTRRVKELLPTVRMLAAMDPQAVQTETDRRYDRMVYELDRLPPDQRPDSYGGYAAALRRHGFELVTQRGMPGDASKKCDWPAFVQASGQWRLIKGFKYEGSGGGAAGPRGADDDGADELEGRSGGGGSRQGSGRRAQAAGGGVSGGSGGPSGGAAGAAAGGVGSGASSGGSGSGGDVGFMCGHCRAMGAAKRCGRCGQHYCSAECQRLDWRGGHKQVCDMVAAQRL